MKATVDKAALLDALAIAAKVAERKSTMPILCNALLRVKGGELHVCATDLRSASIATVPAKDTTPGEITASAADLFRIVSGIKRDAITLTRCDNHYVEIDGGKQVYKLVGIIASDFPKLPTEPKAMESVDAPALSAAISGVLHAASNDSSREHLCGVRLIPEGKSLRAVAVDGHRMALDVAPIAVAFGEHTLPTLAARSLLSLLEGAESVALGLERDHLFARVGARLLASKVNDQQFPPWQSVLPKDSATSVTVDAAELAAAVKRVSGMADHDGKLADGCVLTINGEISIRSEGQQKGTATEEVACERTGPEITIGVACRYLVDALSGIEGKATIGLNTDLDPILVSGAGEQKRVAMPMRL